MHRLEHKVNKLACHVYQLLVNLHEIVCDLYNLKNVKNTHGRKLLYVKRQVKSNAPAWVFFTFFELDKLYQIAQSITYMLKYMKICDCEKEALKPVRTCFM